MSLDRFEKMTQREKDEFSKICNKLMSATYMLRDGTDKLVSREYRFIENEFELFSDYLSLGVGRYTRTHNTASYTLETLRVTISLL